MRPEPVWSPGAREPGLALIVVGYAVLAILYHAATPPLEAPDEAGHVAAALFVKEHFRLPVAGRETSVILATQELAQPPLYYVLAALLTVPIDTSDARAFVVPRPGAPIGRADIAGPKNAWMPREGPSPYRGTRLAISLMRALSTLLGAATVVFTYQIARVVEPRDVTAARFAAALVALNPMFVFVASSVNNDNLVVALVTGCMLLLLRGLGRPSDLRRGVDLGLLAGTAILAKLSAVVVFPALVVGALGKRPRQGLGTLLATGAGVAAVCWWWAMRNRRLYGEWLGLSTFTALAGDARPEVQPLALLREWSGFVKSYWGVFGMFNVVFPEPVYWIFYLITAAGAAGAATLLLRRPVLSPGLPLLMLLSTTNLLAVAWWTSHVWGSQGRLMFPSIASTSVLFAVGLGVLGKRGRDRAAVVISGVLVVLAAYGALVLIPAAYR